MGSTGHPKDVFITKYDPYVRTPTMEQDPRVIALARQIYTAWMNDERWRKAHLHPPQAPQDFPIAYFWAELAARAAIGHG